MSADQAALKALKKFADTVKKKTSALSPGDPEDQLRKPFEILLEQIGEAIGIGVVCKGESQLPGRLGRADYAVHGRGRLAGFAELKAPRKGADPRRFRGHDRDQWKRFSDLPNVLYTDGNEWALWRQGELQRTLLRLGGDICADGGNAASEDNAQALLRIVRDFLEWEPHYPEDAKELAQLLAPLCRLLREDVVDALRVPQSSALVRLARDWRHMLFPDADDQRFADAYAQTVTFGLLLARSEGSTTLDVHDAVECLASRHTLLSRALLILTDNSVLEEISASIALLQRVINSIPAGAFAHREKDPWLHFYERFLAAYDPLLRKNAGVYYTPVEVVQAQVRLTDELLTDKLRKSLGFASPDVVTLDPAAGTGTYLIAVIEHALQHIAKLQGEGAVPGKATDLARNLYGFEIMVGPFSVSELRVTRTLQDYGASLPEKGVGIYLTDTLESPNTRPPVLPQFLDELAEQHKRALRVKHSVPVIVCIGNPPYDRHEAADPADERSFAKTGGWIRWGDVGDPDKAIFKDFVRPVLEAGRGGQVKNLYNLYVYFWRWALWKVFEQKTAEGPGVASFISASSYLSGDAYAGMRQHMREVCDHIWIIDLGGEGRGARQSDNVFDIQTPVAIGIAARYGSADRETPAATHYTRVDGTRAQKLSVLGAIDSFGDFQWQDCPADWQAAFRPRGRGEFFDWPLLTDLLPWQHSGAQAKRTWPIAPDKETLQRRWRALLNAPDRAAAFKETRDRRIARSYPPFVPGRSRQQPIAKASIDAATPQARQYAYRSFDRQWVLADSRLADFMRPALWCTHGDRQIYLTTLLSEPIGLGPAVVACSDPPDLHFFSGRGAKDVMPLFRDPDGRRPNTATTLLDQMSSVIGTEVSATDLLAYVYALLAHPAFTERFREQLGGCELRVPVTKDKCLFAKACGLGARLLWLHTYGERLVPEGNPRGRVPSGAARCAKAVPSDPERYPNEFEYSEEAETLRVGEGEFHPVTRGLWDFQVSGLHVIKSWLRYRLRSGYGRKSSPLDDIRPERWTGEFTTQLLEVMWVLEHTLALYPKQEALLDAVVEGPCFSADEFPAVPDELRQAPKTDKQRGLWADV